MICFIIDLFHERSCSLLNYSWVILFFLDFLNSVFLFQTSFDYYIMMVFCLLLWRKRSFSVHGRTISGIRVTCHPLVLHQAVVTIQALKHRKAVSLQSHVAAGMVPGFSVHVCDITHGTVFRPAETPHSSMQMQALTDRLLYRFSSMFLSFACLQKSQVHPTINLEEKDDDFKLTTPSEAGQIYLSYESLNGVLFAVALLVSVNGNKTSTDHSALEIMLETFWI